MIVGTAGHVDHGKSSLVHALTGVDTDRLAEEKRRGISIELGYAYEPTVDGGMIGYVDVPGHERFIHTMLAGATGIDFALLVVAADDGPMPQTVEHLQVLHLLGLQRGAVALTKVDRVVPQRVAQVERDIRALLAGTGLQDSPVFAVCAPQRRGLEALRAHLHAAACATAPAPGAGMPGRGFRLAVDRCFALDGVGTVVTGGVVAGSVAVGDRLTVSPTGITVRVRGIHAQGCKAEQGHAGQRCALNLAGASKDQIARGDWVLDPALHAPTERLDLQLQLLAEAPCALTGRAAVHLHLGTAHVTGRVVPLQATAIAPGSAGLAQVVLDRPIVALHGDRCILRDAAAARTIGGGIVVDPFAPARHRRAPQRLATLASLRLTDPSAALHGLLAQAPDGVDLAAFCRARNVPATALKLPPGGLRVGAPGAERLLDATHAAALQQRVLAGLARFHAQFEDEQGPDSARLRRIACPALAPPVAEALIASLLDQGRIARTGPWLHLPGHDLRLGPEQERLAARVLPLLAAGGFDPPWVRDIARQLAADEQLVRSVLLRLARRAEVFQVVRDLFYAPAAIAGLARIAAALEAGDGGVRAAAFRDRSGIGRKRTVQILEFFDRVGYTRRTRDLHRLRSDSLLRMAAAVAPAVAPH